MNLASIAITSLLTILASWRVLVPPREILVTIPFALDSLWLSSTTCGQMSRESTVRQQSFVGINLKSGPVYT